VSLAPGAKPLTLSIRPGEVLGVVALAGNGLGSLEDLASGMLSPPSGEILAGGDGIDTLDRGRLRSELLAYMPSDREARGLCLPVSVRDNLLVLRRREFRARAWIGASIRDAAAREASFSVDLVADPRSPAAALSGGNRQRLLLARELDRPRPVLILAEPFQGLDLAAQAEAAALVRALAARGSAVLLLGSNVEDILGVADRVAALYRNELVYEGANEGEASARELLSAMTGASKAGAA
jgi:ABC-type uncharacterized transport system ATPase subunit